MGLTLETRQDAAESAPPSAAPSPSPSAPARRADVRGMSYEQGRQALSPAPTGSALVVGSSQSNQTAKDHLFTPELLRKLDEAPGQSLDAALGELSGRQASVKGTRQYATQALAGDEAARKGGAPGARKFAAFVANAHYKDQDALPSLPATIDEALALEGALAGRGYHSLGVNKDLRASEMKNVMATATAGAHARPGDEVVVHYGGHGVHAGLLGVGVNGVAVAVASAREAARIPGDDGQAIKPDAAALDPGKRAKEGLDPNDVLPYATVKAITDGAIAKGVHASLILDSCYSGNAADAVRDGAAKGSDGAAPAGPREATSDAAAAFASVKAALVRFGETRSAELLALQLRPPSEAEQKDPDNWKKQLEAREALAARYDEVFNQLWWEFLRPRLEAAVKALPEAAARELGPVPCPKSVTSPATLQWIDRATELANHHARGEDPKGAAARP